MTRHEFGAFSAAMLGTASLATGPQALAQVPGGASRNRETPRPEVIVSASRQADAALTARVVTTLQDDPHVFVAHVTVVTENGVVRLEGIATDMADITRAVMLAHQAAGGHRVVNEIELYTDVECHD